MLYTNQYEFNETYKFCIYIQPRNFAFLKNKSRGNISLYLEYLIQKYKRSLLHSKKENALKNAVCHYQPKTKEYKRVVIQKISPELWKRLKELKSMSGYSISFIVRIFIEWEMERVGQPITPLIKTTEEHIQQINYPNFFIPINNYRHHQWWNRRTNEFFSIFMDFP
ncbi:MAG: DUF1564 family protein [Leptonema sp. (in: bacteria)]